MVNIITDIINIHHCDDKITYVVLLLDLFRYLQGVVFDVVFLGHVPCSVNASKVSLNVHFVLSHQRPRMSMKNSVFFRFPP